MRHRRYIRNYGRSYYGATTLPCAAALKVSGSSEYVGLPTLKSGYGGGKSYKVVREVQTFLTSRGSSLPKYGVDGKYGSETAAAVRDYQSSRGLKIDGVVGIQTWTQIFCGGPQFIEKIVAALRADNLFIMPIPTFKFDLGFVDASGNPIKPPVKPPPTPGPGGITPIPTPIPTPTPTPTPGGEECGVMCQVERYGVYIAGGLAAIGAFFIYKKRKG